MMTVSLLVGKFAKLNRILADETYVTHGYDDLGRKIAKEEANLENKSWKNIYIGTQGDGLK